ncbi:MAG: hypothetical protein ACR2PL_06115 [Dehalococcoidia bacterium]
MSRQATTITLSDEQTGIGVREPAAPSQPPAPQQPEPSDRPLAPGQPARREFESVRHGTVDLLAAGTVGDGQAQRHRPPPASRAGVR